jgi:hypothetical protein
VIASDPDSKLTRATLSKASTNAVASAVSGASTVTRRAGGSVETGGFVFGMQPVMMISASGGMIRIVILTVLGLLYSQWRGCAHVFVTSTAANRGFVLFD